MRNAHVFSLGAVDEVTKDAAAGILTRRGADQSQSRYGDASALASACPVVPQ